jgi:CubicO group peptidase (beta-lactamase class C family)
MHIARALFFLSFFAHASEKSVLQQLYDAETEIDTAIYQAIAKHEVPGAVVLISHQNNVAYHKAIGYKSLTPSATPLTTDTLFDLASLTKVMVTAPLIMLLAEREQLNLKAPISQYIPAFGQQGKAPITIEQLLTHASGLIADNPEADYAQGKQNAFERIHALAPIAPAGTFIYSDVGYILLGELIEQITGESLDTYAQKHIFMPLGMHDTMFAPTQVHDPRARLLGGIAGHAGLFSTIDDIARFCAMIMHEGNYNDTQVLQASSVRAMETPHKLAYNQIRGLGWDIKTDRSPYYQGSYFTTAFGHVGFTGTSLLFDRPSETFIIILTNRLHPDGKGDAKPLRRQIADIVGKILYT